MTGLNRGCSKTKLSHRSFSTIAFNHYLPFVPLSLQLDLTLQSQTQNLICRLVPEGSVASGGPDGGKEGPRVGGAPCASAPWQPLLGGICAQLHRRPSLRGSYVPILPSLQLLSWRGADCSLAVPRRPLLLLPALASVSLAYSHGNLTGGGLCASLQVHCNSPSWALQQVSQGSSTARAQCLHLQGPVPVPLQS